MCYVSNFYSNYIYNCFSQLHQTKTDGIEDSWNLVDSSLDKETASKKSIPSFPVLDISSTKEPTTIATEESFHKEPKAPPQIPVKDPSFGSQPLTGVLNGVVKNPNPAVVPTITPPKGMSNCGNYCYMISTLQCLFSLNGFKREMHEGTSKLTAETREFYATYEASNSVSAERVASFLNALLPWSWELKEAPKDQHDPVIIVDLLVTQELPISRIATAEGCLPTERPVSEKHLQLRFPTRSSSVSLQNLVDKRFETEEASDCVFDCEDGSKKRMKSYQIKDTWVTSLPIPYLPLKLERCDPSGRKNNTPVEGTLNPVFLGDHSYKVGAFTVHLDGGLTKGHHVSYVKRDGTWYQCNDNTITPMREEQVKEASKQAHVLFLQ